jgi:hypothetical protein
MPDVVGRIPPQRMVLDRVVVDPRSEERFPPVLTTYVLDDIAHEAQEVLMASAAHGSKSRVLDCVLLRASDPGRITRKGSREIRPVPRPWGGIPCGLHCV